VQTRLKTRLKAKETQQNSTTCISDVYEFMTNNKFVYKFGAMGGIFKIDQSQYVVWYSAISAVWPPLKNMADMI